MRFYLLAMIIITINIPSGGLAGYQPEDDEPQVDVNGRRQGNGERDNAELQNAPHAIFEAVASGDRAKVRAYIAKGLDLNVFLLNDGGRQITPLMIAIVKGYEDIATDLVNAGAQVTPSYEGYNARDFAAYALGDQARIVRKLDNLFNHEANE